MHSRCPRIQDDFCRRRLIAVTFPTSESGSGFLCPRSGGGHARALARQHRYEGELSRRERRRRSDLSCDQKTRLLNNASRREKLLNTLYTPDGAHVHVHTQTSGPSWLLMRGF